MRLICRLLLLIPVVMASTKYYSINGRIYCGMHPYTGEAKMWILRGTDIKSWVVPYDVLEIASVLKTLPIINGYLNAKVEDEHDKSIKSYYLTIDDPTCCPQGAASYKSLPYMAETFNFHDDKEVAQINPFDLKKIDLINYCSGVHKESVPQN